MKVMSFFIFLALLLGFSSCKKEALQPTQAQLNQQELQQVIKKNGIDRVEELGINESFPSYFSSEDGMSFTFSNGFISIYGYAQSFNLAYLAAYNIQDVIIRDNQGNTSTAQALVLYFNF